MSRRRRVFCVGGFGEPVDCVAAPTAGGAVLRYLERLGFDFREGLSEDKAFLVNVDGINHLFWCESELIDRARWPEIIKPEHLERYTKEEDLELRAVRPYLTPLEYEPSPLCESSPFGTGTKS